MPDTQSKKWKYKTVPEFKTFTASNMVCCATLLLYIYPIFMYFFIHLSQSYYLQLSVSLYKSNFLERNFSKNLCTFHFVTHSLPTHSVSHSLIHSVINHSLTSSRILIHSLAHWCNLIFNFGLFSVHLLVFKGFTLNGIIFY